MALTPTSASQTERTWHYGEVRVHAQLQQGWQLHRSWARDVICLDKGPPALEAGLGEEPVVVHLDRPTVAVPGSTLEFWVQWPLLFKLRVDGELVDAGRPAMRAAVLGSIESGRVLPAARARRIDGPDVQPPWAALHLPGFRLRPWQDPARSQAWVLRRLRRLFGVPLRRELRLDLQLRRSRQLAV